MVLGSTIRGIVALPVATTAIRTSATPTTVFVLFALPRVALLSPLLSSAFALFTIFFTLFPGALAKRIRRILRLEIFERFGADFLPPSIALSTNLQWSMVISRNGYTAVGWCRGSRPNTPNGNFFLSGRLALVATPYRP